MYIANDKSNTICRQTKAHVSTQNSLYLHTNTIPPRCMVQLDQLPLSGGGFNNTRNTSDRLELAVTT